MAMEHAWVLGPEEGAAAVDGGDTAKRVAAVVPVGKDLVRRPTPAHLHR